ncbi:hypothetical protein QVD17_00855 [Tagetes erecta]|uniref:Uncharacterized protein n=1 Tax=Tagetes erecta TaxID=13708 RepID=A0AAD8L3X4_TARER|nr:hypothetical protein QVD17_00855 [Tagetes erecta]
MESYASSSSGDSTSTGEIEMDNAVTSAVALAASFLQHVANPPRPVYQRVSVERDRAAANERLMKDYFDPVEHDIMKLVFGVGSNFMRNKEAHYALTADLVEHCWLNRRVTRDD